MGDSVQKMRQANEKLQQILRTNNTSDWTQILSLIDKEDTSVKDAFHRSLVSAGHHQLLSDDTKAKAMAQLIVLNPEIIKSAPDDFKQYFNSEYH